LLEKYLQDLFSIVSYFGGGVHRKRKRLSYSGIFLEQTPLEYHQIMCIISENWKEFTQVWENM